MRYSLAMGPYKVKFRSLVRAIIKKYELDKKSTKVLDIACADGKHISLFSGMEYTGADKEPDLISECRIKHPNSTFFVADLEEEKKLTNEKFDFVVCTHTFAHISDQKKYTALIHLANCAKKDGLVLLQVTRKDLPKVEGNIPASLIEMERRFYKGFISSVAENLFSDSWHLSRPGALINYLLQFIDFGKENCIIVFKKVSLL